MGWAVETEWFEAEGRTCLRLELGRILRPGENRAAKGDRWIYRLVWEEIPVDDRPNLHHSRMKIAVCRALTPNTGQWKEGPSLKMIADMMARNPKPHRPSLAVQAIKTSARSVTA